MCGIAGFINRSENEAKDCLAAKLSMMLGTITHRGPDSSDVWIHKKEGVYIGHNRLSIIDLSENGRQPAISDDGKYILSFNGEIYNFRSLAQDLQDYDSNLKKYNSDTQVLLSLIQGKGLANALKNCIGMFSLVLYDIERNTLSMARDRFGIKPLYYRHENNLLIFGSEIRTILSYTGKLPPSPSLISEYLQLGYMQGENTIFQEIKKLLPAQIITWDLNRSISKSESIKYWKPVFERRNINEISFNEAESQISEALKDSVKLCNISDVPLGIFLSGGIDSSLLLAISSELTSKKVNTFTIGFNDDKYNEAKHARRIAEYYQTNHLEHIFSDTDLINLVPNIFNIFDEPFADTSQIPTYLLCKLAKENVTVALSGDGGDEAFAGYSHYFTTTTIRKLSANLPDIVKNYLSVDHAGNPSQSVAKLVSLYSYFFKNPNSDKIHKVLRMININDACRMYRKKFSYWENPKLALSEECSVEYDEYIGTDNVDEAFIDWMMATDIDSYLPDDILVKSDRTSMSNSLEVRVPFLDHRLVEAAQKLPLEYISGNKNGKLILKKLLKSKMPENLFMRPKMGFGVPMADWLRGPLKEWSRSLLETNKLRSYGMFNEVYINSLFESHCSGKQDNSRQLWSLLVLLNWLDQLYDN